MYPDVQIPLARLVPLDTVMAVLIAAVGLATLVPVTRMAWAAATRRVSRTGDAP